MWQDPYGDLTPHLQQNNTIQIESLIIAEWNMNDFQKIANTGTYRYRPINSSSQYYRLPTKYDALDIGDFYTDADKSSFTYSDFVDDNDEPVLFESTDVNRKLYFDIEQCFHPFRPRSGINKLLYFNKGVKYIDNVTSARRPRYYMATRYDTFKYWNSYRSQVNNNVVSEYGVSAIKNIAGFNDSIGYVIEDTAPFVVYEEPVPANRIVVKMQTNLAEVSKGLITTTSGTKINDPLGDRSKSSIPQRWKIEYLDEENNWIEAISFDENSQRPNSGLPIVGWDGYVELYYGIKIPEGYRTFFHFVGYADSVANIPIAGANTGEAYIVGLSESSPGALYVWDSEANEWYTEGANYGFSLYNEENDTEKNGILSSLTNQKYYLLDGKKVYSEFSFIKGLRLSVSTMIAKDQTFDLIELSPRLKANISDYTVSFNITKSIGNDDTKLPVGSLLASNGDITLMNVDDAFALNNQNSIIAKYLKPNIKFDIYEIVLNVDGYDKYIPLQSLYAEDFPNAIGGMNTITVPLRDQFFRFESMRSPEIFLTNTTLTSAIALMLDHCGFSNYVFKGFDDLRYLETITGESIEYPTYYPPSIAWRTPTDSIDLSNLYIGLNLQNAWEAYWIAAKRYTFTPVAEKITVQNKIRFLAGSLYDPIIPFFFVNNEQSVAETLSELAAATQTAMFFDEYNNFVVMPKEYLMPSTRGKRTTDLILNGQVDGNNLPNIVTIDASEQQILNDGVIKYSIKYIQKVYNSLSQAQYVDQDKTFVYKPVLLWEVGSNQEGRSTDGDKTQSSGYALSAVTLNTPLNPDVPFVVNNSITNNIIDVGESAVWLGRFQGYLYANGEIIRYDAIQYSISGVGNVWITSNREYQSYFSKLPFNGKIYPTGNIRIFAEPYYENLKEATTFSSSNINLNESVRYKNGAVQRHGRGQFGTEITSHSSGLPEYWSNRSSCNGIWMETQYLFTTTPINNIVYPAQGAVTNLIGSNPDAFGIATTSTRNGIIKNFLRSTYPTDSVIKKLKSTSSGTVQSSALVFSGPEYGLTQSDKIKFVTYVHKPLDSSYKHFGTRMRIIGRYEVDPNIGQSANNGSSQTSYYSVTPTNSSDPVSIGGGSGGIAIGFNPSTNHGYFFEICALSNTNLESYTSINTNTGAVEKVLHNIVFYKTYSQQTSPTLAIPKKLWGGLAPISIDEGLFVGQDRIGLEDKPTVYDLAVEYVNIGTTRRFFLYINNRQVATVDDPNPLPQYNNIALFVRGQSQCMFENVYALQDLFSQNTESTVITGVASAFGDDKISTSEAMRKYSIPGFVKSTYLAGVNSSSQPNYKIYFEEFGTILRECAYFNIKYDQAYPALTAILAPTFNNERGYSVSGFKAGAYGAEFLIFNTTDKAIVLDESTGNYLRILGVTFTQQTSEELTVDDFFKRLSNFSNPVSSDAILRSPIAAKEVFETIESNRKKYGKKEFSIESEYIQSSDDADKLMEWIMSKVLRKRDKLVVTAFGVPHLQLGDIVAIDYELNDIKYINNDKLFVVQGISNSKDAVNRSTQLTLMEI